MLSWFWLLPVLQLVFPVYFVGFLTSFHLIIFHFFIWCPQYCIVPKPFIPFIALISEVSFFLIEMFHNFVHCWLWSSISHSMLAQISSQAFLMKFLTTLLLFVFCISSVLVYMYLRYAFFSFHSFYNFHLSICNNYLIYSDTIPRT